MERQSQTYSKDELLLRLCEPYGSLSAEELSAAKALAVKDADAAEALEECRGMSRLSEAAVMGTPRTSDVEFLVSLRDRLAESERPFVFRPAFGTRRLTSLATAVCVMVIVVILAAGNRSAPMTAQTVNSQALESLASALDPTAPLVPDSISDSSVDAESLAVYLDVPELASNWDFETNTTDESMSDELLSLDPQTLQEVMNDIENANFF